MMLSPEAAYWLIVLWFAAIGAAIGSFLNVVVYRLPAGISLIDPPSHCVSCKRGIRWFDNVPVFGWLKLRGRCRYCRSTISVRYPLVEAFTAAMFGTLAAVEYLSTAANLPHPLPTATEGILVVVVSGAELLGLYLYHLTLLCTLLCAALIEADGNRPPARLFHPALTMGILLPLYWPALRPWAVSWPWAARPEMPPWAAGAVDALAGLAAAALLAWAIAWAGKLSRVGQAKRRPTVKDGGRRRGGTAIRCSLPTGTSLGLACVGLFLGWQAAIVLALATGVVKLELAALPPYPRWLRQQIPASAVLMALSLIWILAWARLVSPWEP